MREIKLDDLEESLRDEFTRDYAKHRKQCAEYEIAPETMERFLIEWLDCKKREGKNEKSLAQRSDEDLQRRDYGRMYLGKSGFDF